MTNITTSSLRLGVEQLATRNNVLVDSILLNFHKVWRVQCYPHDSQFPCRKQIRIQDGMQVHHRLTTRHAGINLQQSHLEQSEMWCLAYPIHATYKLALLHSCESHICSRFFCSFVILSGMLHDTVCCGEKRNSSITIVFF